MKFANAQYLTALNQVFMQDIKSDDNLYLECGLYPVRKDTEHFLSLQNKNTENEGRDRRVSQVLSPSHLKIDSVHWDTKLIT